ncbi:MAG: nickel-dependent lactate racemase [Verrucomicrobiota bacterium]
MNVKLAYGQGWLPVDFPADRTTVIEPTPLPGLPDERAALFCALDAPIQTRPLREWVRPDSRVVITFTDITRATPNHRLIPWLLEYLKPLVKSENIVLMNSLGTHRSNSRAELERMLTPAVVANYRIVDNEPENAAAHVQFGNTHDGTPVLLHHEVAKADVRILTGFIEPHFFAGFSGGPKAIMPGVAHLKTVMSNHGARQIADPNATWGITQGNPIWEEMRDIALRVGDSFLLNVTLNEAREVTGLFAGELLAAHRAGTEFVRCSAMQAVAAMFEVVVTTNSGYPLDQNLYQGVKGLSAGARILKPGGTLILACECRDGMPNGSPYERFLKSAASPEEVLTRLTQASEAVPEQWQAQIQALIQRRAQVLVHSSLPDAQLRGAHLVPCSDIATVVRERLANLPATARVAVLPQGPLTVPYLTGR